MLHAELRDKLTPDTPAPARIEDTLTSTVFGTLLLAAGGIGVLCDWLNAARRFRPEDGTEEAIPVVESADFVTYWFWQRGVGGEPDLLLRIGARFFIIEAKYFSGKSGGSDEDPADTGLPKDQLAKYWLACQPGVQRDSYPADLEDAIVDCTKHILYLVSSAHRLVFDDHPSAPPLDTRGTRVVERNAERTGGHRHGTCHSPTRHLRLSLPGS